MVKGIGRFTISGLLILLSLILGLSLLKYSPSDIAEISSYVAPKSHNFLGFFGAKLAHFFVFFYGQISYLWAVFFAYIGIRISKGILPSDLIKSFLLMQYLACVSAGLLSFLISNPNFVQTGVFGVLLFQTMTMFLNSPLWVPLLSFMLVLGLVLLYLQNPFLSSLLSQRTQHEPILQTAGVGDISAEEWEEEFYAPPQETVMAYQHQEEAVLDRGYEPVRESSLEERLGVRRTIEELSPPSFLQEIREEELGEEPVAFLSKKPLFKKATEESFLSNDVDIDLLSPYLREENTFYDQIKKNAEKLDRRWKSNPQQLLESAVESLEELEQSSSSLELDSVWVKETGFKAVDIVRRQHPALRLSFDDGIVENFDDVSAKEIDSSNDEETITPPSQEEISSQPETPENPSDEVILEEIIEEPQHVSKFDPVDDADGIALLGENDPAVVFSKEVSTLDSSLKNSPTTIMQAIPLLTDTEKILVKGIERTNDRQQEKLQELKNKLYSKHQELAEDYYKQHHNIEIDTLPTQSLTPISMENKVIEISHLSEEDHLHYQFMDFQQELEELKKNHQSSYISSQVYDDSFLNSYQEDTSVSSLESQEEISTKDLLTIIEQPSYSYYDEDAELEDFMILPLESSSQSENKSFKKDEKLNEFNTTSMSVLDEMPNVSALSLGESNIQEMTALDELVSDELMITQEDESADEVLDSELIGDFSEEDSSEKIDIDTPLTPDEERIEQNFMIQEFNINDVMASENFLNPSVNKDQDFTFKEQIISQDESIEDTNENFIVQESEEQITNENNSDSLDVFQLDIQEEELDTVMAEPELNTEELILHSHLEEDDHVELQAFKSSHNIESTSTMIPAYEFESVTAELYEGTELSIPSDLLEVAPLSTYSEPSYARYDAVEVPQVLPVAHVIAPKPQEPAKLHVPTVKVQTHSVDITEDIMIDWESVQKSIPSKNEIYQQMHDELIQQDVKEIISEEKSYFAPQEKVEKVVVQETQILDPVPSEAIAPEDEPLESILMHDYEDTSSDVADLIISDVANEESSPILIKPNSNEDFNDLLIHNEIYEEEPSNPMVHEVSQEEHDITDLAPAEALLMPTVTTESHLVTPEPYPVPEHSAVADEEDEFEQFAESAKTEELDSIDEDELKKLGDELGLDQFESAFDDEELSQDHNEEFQEDLAEEISEPVSLIKKEFIYPSIEDLTPNEDQISQFDEDDEIETTMKMIEDTYESFNINMQVVDYSRGPTITRFELEPPSGLKLRTILNLQDDLSLQAGTSNIRIISPVEGRSLIGIEVPNKVRRNFLLREQIESKRFQDIEAELPLILGADVGGKEYIGDLATTPHLLIAGTTGSGKSVYVNALIMGLLFKLSPEDLRFIMIDPKMVELELYNGIPHLLAPIITKPEEAMVALEWAVEEMDRRYKLLSEFGVRNIKEYRAMASEEPSAYEKMPYIVVIVDEFANLMLRAPKDTERHISRLASMSRAVGIHLVLATQRPSVDVVTGVIKANFPSRIALRVSSKIDSRTIIDRNGAETLLGRGDMLFMSPNEMEPVRIQSPYASSEDVARAVLTIKKNGTPDYVIDFSEVLSKQEEGETESSRVDAMNDPLFEEVLRHAVDNGEISASGIQRRFRVGYNRASRLIESMKDLKIISAPPGVGKGWQINITRNEIDNYLN